MAQDSEKRFHQIMDKLLNGAATSTSTPSTSSSSSQGGQQTRGKKRLNPSSALAIVEPKTGAGFSDKFHHASARDGSLQAPLCKPWDRGDLMRRLATFKSMTWFAKPQVVNAVNCARRGWINVDMDTIACESCGARLLFSTPSSWPQQQVEKAALVFSLKLDSGHKLLCPWIDNHCDESLVEFPSMTPQDLVDRFRERSNNLLHLLALPMISSYAIESMRSPELEEFLKEPIMLDTSYLTTEFSQSNSSGNEHEESSGHLYYQAHKFISLCGWEPRSLSYFVDCKENSCDFVRNTDVVNAPYQVAKGKLLSIISRSSDANEISDLNKSPSSRCEPESDPKSVVLDCKLCGASAGLWVFSTIPRPLEFCRVIGHTEVNPDKRSDGQTSVGDLHHDNRFEQATSLNMTIAGGPSATKQNFKATVSLPVIGRNLRARFVSDGRNCRSRDLIDSGSELVTQLKTIELLENVSDDSAGKDQHKTAKNSDSITNADGSALSASATEQVAYETVSNESVLQERISTQSTNQEFGSYLSTDQVSNKVKGSTAGKYMIESSSSKQMEFDPIRQHRHFCPWIASGKKLPGWRQTLLALRRKSSSLASPLSASQMKLDDPLTSVRNLFMSPSPKRPKTSRGSC